MFIHVNQSRDFNGLARKLALKQKQPNRDSHIADSRNALLGKATCHHPERNSFNYTWRSQLLKGWIVLRTEQLSPESVCRR